MFSSRRRFADDERQRLAATIDAIYDDFVGKVAAGRGRSVAEIEAVTDYMIANVQRRGEPTYAECAAFFGEGARVCNTYKAADATAAKQE